MIPAAPLPAHFGDRRTPFSKSYYLDGRLKTYIWLPGGWKTWVSSTCTRAEIEEVIVTLEERIERENWGQCRN